MKKFNIALAFALVVNLCTLIEVMADHPSKMPENHSISGIWKPTKILCNGIEKSFTVTVLDKINSVISYDYLFEVNGSKMNVYQTGLSLGYANGVREYSGYATHQDKYELTKDKGNLDIRLKKICNLIPEKECEEPQIKREASYEYELDGSGTNLTLKGSKDVLSICKLLRGDPASITIYFKRMLKL